MTKIGMIAAALATLALVHPPDAHACYWDSDTLAMEKQRFPGTLELITGKFLRRTPELYRWRIQDRLAKLQADPTNLALHDDLAVAYDQLGEHAEAIKVMEAKARLRPDVYETHANLGTFYIHAGEPERGLVHIKKAIEINPNAHFGREVMQQRLAEYLLARRSTGGTGLPVNRTWLSRRSSEIRYVDTESRIIARAHELEKRPIEPPDVPDYPLFELQGFAAFSASHGHGRAEAIKGIQGMMKFSDHESPILLEALGDLLLYDGKIRQDAKQLAAMAYLKASYSAAKAGDDLAQQRYRAKAVLALYAQRKTSLVKVEAELRKEIARADRWFASIARQEQTWIAQGKDADALFARRYYQKAQ